MKKLLVLLSSVLMTGCFICHKGAPKEETIEAVEEVVEIVYPAPQVKVISRYSIPEAANFAFDSKEIRSDMNKMVELERDIVAHPEATIVVEGYTDNIGTEEYNQELSYQRAMEVAKVLAQKDYPNEIRVSAKGSSNPIASNATEKGRAQNRRVDVVLISE
jgi:outer membrane protein OmpA-like peptidoglycan-associated protein